MECALLGALIVDGSAFMRIAEIIHPSSFYVPAHGVIYQAMGILHGDNRPIDLVTVCEQLQRMSALEKVGGPVKISELADAMPSSANIEYYARVVYEKAQLRRIIACSNDIATIAYDPGSVPVEVLQRAMRSFADLARAGDRTKVLDGAQLASATFKFIGQLDRSKATDGELERYRISTGFERLDGRLHGGMMMGNLLLLAARPGMGKTSLALKMAYLAAKRGIPTAFISLEMMAEELGARLLSSISNIPLSTILDGYKLNEHAKKRMMEGLNQIHEAPIYLVDNCAATLPAVEHTIDRLVGQMDVRLVVLDYIQLIQGDSDSRTNDVSKVSGRLKSLAKTYRMPILALSQLNRQTENRPNSRPQLSDLRDSGSLEQDSDVVMFIYRPEYYASKKKTSAKTPDTATMAEGTAEVIFAKNRQGSTGSSFIAWRGEFTSFDNLLGSPEISHNSA